MLVRCACRRRIWKWLPAAARTATCCPCGLMEQPSDSPSGPRTSWTTWSSASKVPALKHAITWAHEMNRGKRGMIPRVARFAAACKLGRTGPGQMGAFVSALDNRPGWASGVWGPRLNGAESHGGAIKLVDQVLHDPGAASRLEIISGGAMLPHGIADHRQRVMIQRRLAQ